MELQLQQIRKRAGLSQQQMADALGIKKRTYGSWERQEVSLSLEQAYDCAVILGCSIDAIAGYDPPVSYSDPGQAALNAYFESMNSAGRGALVESARLMSGSPDTRIEKDRPERLRVPPQVERSA